MVWGRKKKGTSKVKHSRIISRGRMVCNKKFVASAHWAGNASTLRIQCYLYKSGTLISGLLQLRERCQRLDNSVHCQDMLCRFGYRKGSLLAAGAPVPFTPHFRSRPPRLDSVQLFRQPEAATTDLLGQIGAFFTYRWLMAKSLLANGLMSMIKIR